jgi:hypothetical protein
MFAQKSDELKNRAVARKRVEAVVTVHESTAAEFEAGEGPKLSVISIRESFSGGIEAESVVRALQTQHEDGRATMASLQRVTGTLDGRQGTFVLQGEERIEKGAIHATWFVVPGSGTGDLTGLRGEGGFEGHFGQGSRGTLDYWFE